MKIIYKEKKESRLGKRTKPLGTPLETRKDAECAVNNRYKAIG